MFKTIFSVIAAVSIGAAALAQKTEGHVSYNVEFSSKQPEVQMQLGMLQGSKLEMYFTEGRSRTEMKVGMIMQTTTIVDTKKKETLTLLSGMVGQKAIAEPLNTSADAPKPTVELINETKEIAGYKCKKAIISDEEGNSYDFWYTEEIKAIGDGQKYFGGNAIPGFPMQMEINQQGMNIKMVADSYEKLPKKHNLFDMKVPEGYQLMTKEELGKMMGGF